MKCDAHVRNVLVTHDYLIENEITRIAMQDASKCIFNIFKTNTYNKNKFSNLNNHVLYHLI